ncbi:MAG TPA: YciI family protein, partial [Devosia sp.]
EVRDMDHAVEWVKKCPNPMPGPSEIEIRPVYEFSDFDEIMTTEAADVHGRVTEKLSAS